MDDDGVVTSIRWQRAMARLVFMNLERVETEFYIASLSADQRETLKELIRQWIVKQDLIGMTQEKEGESDARLCWAIHTGKTARELLGRVGEIENVGELIDVAQHDHTADMFGGWIEPLVFRLLMELIVPNTESEQDVRVNDPSHDSACGRLSPDQPFVILCVAKQPSMPRSTSDAPKHEAQLSSSLPPPLN